MGVWCVGSYTFRIINKNQPIKPEGTKSGNVFDHSTKKGLMHGQDPDCAQLRILELAFHPDLSVYKSLLQNTSEETGAVINLVPFLLKAFSDQSTAFDYKSREMRIHSTCQSFKRKWYKRTNKQLSCGLRVYEFWSAQALASQGGYSGNAMQYKMSVVCIHYSYKRFFFQNI